MVGCTSNITGSPTILFTHFMEYKVWRKKNGEEIVLTDLRKLLLDYYEVDSIPDLLPNLGTSGEYHIECPLCVQELDYHKEKLYINGEITVGHCKRCSRSFVHISDELTFDVQGPTENQIENFGLVKLNHPIWNLNLFNEFDEFDEIGYDYLVNKRHKYLGELSKLLKFRYHNHNIVMPFYYHGELVYYQVRYINGRNVGFPYFNPPIDKKFPYLIEHGDNKKIIIAEGVFDCIANLLMFPEWTPMGILGSSITNYQIEILRSFNPSDILIFMDETSISLKIKQKISSVLNHIPINIIPSDGTDPEEHLKSRIKSGRNLLWQ